MHLFIFRQSVKLLSRLEKFANERSWVRACLLRKKHLEKEHVQAGKDRNDHVDTLFIRVYLNKNICQEVV